MDQTTLLVSSTCSRPGSLTSLSVRLSVRISLASKALLPAAHQRLLRSDTDMWRISKTFQFSAAHYLNDLAEGHPCGRLHGHNYEVELYLESPVLDDVGFVRDYGELGRFKTWLDNTFDHRQINYTIAQPTAENMAKLFYERAV